MKKVFIFSLFTLIAISTFSQNSEHFEWLTGTWKGPGFGGTFEEVWSEPDTNGQLMGMFRYFDKDGSVQFLEFWILDETGMKLKHFDPDFKAWEEKEDFIDFRMVETTETKVTLKGLSYERTSKNEMVVSLKMKQGEEVKTEVFNLKRVKK
jgi:hypothetical protein